MTIEQLTRELTALEQELCGALVEVHNSRFNLLHESLAPTREGIADLKAVVDRLRSLLWVWMHRLEGKHLPEKVHLQPPAQSA